MEYYRGPATKKQLEIVYKLRNLFLVDVVLPEIEYLLSWQVEWRRNVSSGDAEV